MRAPRLPLLLLCGALIVAVPHSTSWAQRESELNQRDQSSVAPQAAPAPRGPVTVSGREEKWGPSHKEGVTGKVLYGWWVTNSDGSSAWVGNKGGSPPAIGSRVSSGSSGSASNAPGGSNGVGSGSARPREGRSRTDVDGSNSNGVRSSDSASDGEPNVIRPGSTGRGTPSTGGSSNPSADDGNVIRPKSVRPRSNSSSQSDSVDESMDGNTSSLTKGNGPGGLIKGVDPLPFIDPGPLNVTAQSLSEKKRKYAERSQELSEYAGNLEAVKMQLDELGNRYDNKLNDLGTQRTNIVSRAERDARNGYRCPNGLDWNACDDPNHVMLKLNALDRAKKKALDETGIDKEIEWVKSQESARKKALEKLADKIASNNAAIERLNAQFDVLAAQIKQYKSQVNPAVGNSPSSNPSSK